MSVRPSAVTICQNCAVECPISLAEAAADSTINVVSDGLAINSPVSVAVPRDDPRTRSSAAVTSALVTSTASTPSAIAPIFCHTTARSMPMPTVIRNTPSARPLKGPVSASTSFE